MSDIRHILGLGFNSDIEIDTGGETTETFYLLTENADRMITEDDNTLILENGG